LTVSQVELLSIQISTAMSNSTSWYTMLVEIMISSKNQRVSIQDLSNLTLQIILDAYWVSLNGGTKSPIVRNISTHAPLGQFYFHCVIEETGSPGTKWILCHQVLRYPLANQTSSMGHCLVANAHIVMLNEVRSLGVTELTSCMVDETALATSMRRGSPGITVVCSHRIIIFNLQVRY